MLGLRVCGFLGCAHHQNKFVKFGVKFAYRICRIRKGAVRRHSSTLSPHSLLRKRRRQSQSHLKDVESILFLFHYPSVDSHLSTALNHHPNMAIIDRNETFTCDGSFGLEDEVFVGVNSDKTDSFEQKDIKVLGVSFELTLNKQMDNNYWPQPTLQHFEQCIKKLSTLPLPVNILFIDTAFPKDVARRRNETVVDLSSLEKFAKRTNISLLSVEQHRLSPRSFLTKICTFVGLGCSQYYLDSAVSAGSL